MESQYKFDGNQEKLKYGDGREVGEMGERRKHKSSQGLKSKTGHKKSTCQDYVHLASLTWTHAFLGSSEQATVLSAHGPAGKEAWLGREGLAVFARGSSSSLRRCRTLLATELNFQKGRKQNWVIGEGYTSIKKN